MGGGERKQRMTEKIFSKTFLHRIVDLFKTFQVISQSLRKVQKRSCQFQLKIQTIARFFPEAVHRSIQDILQTIFQIYSRPFQGLKQIYHFHTVCDIFNLFNLMFSLFKKIFISIFILLAKTYMTHIDPNQFTCMYFVLF